jgi:hypothetical protein
MLGVTAVTNQPLPHDATSVASLRNAAGRAGASATSLSRPTAVVLAIHARVKRVLTVIVNAEPPAP